MDLGKMKGRRHAERFFIFLCPRGTVSAVAAIGASFSATLYAKCQLSNGGH